ncbi:MAG: hypothetical protein FD133_364 [Erysipelotrichaceae bacterium]|nr:MAG: hypothetical protein FD133_364 [Erysipelotrichaceae bacterium]
MKIYTIGFTKKSAETFFTLLKSNDVKLLLDTRLNNISQLAGFAKGKDLEYFCREIAGIDYIHDLRFAPNDEILKLYREKEISWKGYEERFIQLMKDRGSRALVQSEYLGKLSQICIMCSEELPDKCHRRLVAEYIQECFPELEIEIVHLY